MSEVFICIYFEPPANFIWCSFPVYHLHPIPDFTAFCHILCLQSYFPELKSHSGLSINLIRLFCIFSGFSESSLSLPSRNPRSSIAMCNCNSLCPSVSWSCLWAQPISDRRRPPLMPLLAHRAWHKRRLFLFCSPSIYVCALSILPWPPKAQLTWKEVSLPFVVYFIVHFFPTLMNKEWVHLQGGTCKGKSISWLTDGIRKVAL